VRQVEALIAACEDLDELEALEAALQKRTMAALDAVLSAARKAALAKADAEAAAAESEAAAGVGGATAEPAQ
jgi:hypothetical protein